MIAHQPASLYVSQHLQIVKGWYAFQTISIYINLFSTLENRQKHTLRIHAFFFFLFLHRVYLQAHQANFNPYTEETKVFATQKLKQAVENLTRFEIH